MKSLPLIISVLLFFRFSVAAEELIRERVYIHTDKNCYVAGEDIWVKFYLINSNFQPSALSKVGYVEICDTEKPQIQLKIALENGNGAGKIQIPADLPSGFYRLSGYTRYMRNEGENVFFEKPVAIINAEQQSLDSKRMELIEEYENIQSFSEQSKAKEPGNLVIKTDQNRYGNRKKVVLSLNNIPDNTADLVISVCRNDSFTFVPEMNRQEWLKNVKNSLDFSRQWIPEYEGHIIGGRFIPELKDERLLTSIGFVGNDIRYFTGQINAQSGSTNFYTAGIFGKQQIVTSVVSQTYNKVPYRLDLLSPFCEFLPENLPVLQICMNNQQLLERYISAQIQRKLDDNSIDNPIQSPVYSTFQPMLSYKLDEYTRFSTVSETILEFINRVRVTRIGGVQKIKVYFEEVQRYNIGNTLVLLDGIPIYDHEEILRYNPMNIKRIDIYDGRYLFGGEDIECIVSFITHKGDLPFFHLSEGSQLFDYDCPQLPPVFEIPDYSKEEMLNSRKPDFRHTLYWNPFVELTKNRPVNLSFYTSDLCGEFKVSVEGITTDGKLLHGVAYFHVIKQ